MTRADTLFRIYPPLKCLCKRHTLWALARSFVAEHTDPLLTCYRSRIMSELLPSEKYSLPAVLLHWAIAVPGDQVFRRMLP